MRFSKLSLPTRLSLAASLVLLATTVVADSLAIRELRASLSGSVAASLGSMIRRMAVQLDQDILTLSDLLAGEAAMLEQLDSETVRNVLPLRGAGLNFAFDYGILLVAASGEVVSDSMNRPEWLGRNLAGEEFFQRTFSVGAPLISAPFPSPAPDATPIAMFTHPLRDRDRRLVGLLAGGVDLTQNRLLAKPTGVRTSRYGQIGVFTLDGAVIAHTEQDFLLQQFENPVATLPKDGDAFRTTEITAADGTRALLAAALLKNAHWLVAGVFPSIEVYAPIERGFAAAHRWFVVGLAACALLLWRLSTKAVRDLDALAGEMTALAGAGGLDGRRVGENYRAEAATMAGAVNALLASLDSARADIDDLTSRLAETEERERRAIAADLHDSVCQTLALANMRLGGVKKRLGEGADARTVEEVRALLSQSVAELKSLTFNLSPTILYELGLAPALEWLARDFGDKRGVAVTVDARGGEALGDELSIFLYRAVNELLTNAGKHAAASAVAVTAGEYDGGYRVTVADNGTGTPEALARGDGFGLRNLRMRVRQLGGRLDVEAAPGGGIAVSVWTPLKNTHGDAT